MARAVISSKFQLVIPKAVREQAGLKVGQVVQVIARDDVISVIPDRPLSELRGMFKGRPRDDYRDEADRL
jgi:AbrB family looped-hinge helix DNA binding protein